MLIFHFSHRYLTKQFTADLLPDRHNPNYLLCPVAGHLFMLQVTTLAGIREAANPALKSHI